jgi:hypothetical protein
VGFIGFWVLGSPKNAKRGNGEPVMFIGRTTSAASLALAKG